MKLIQLTQGKFAIVDKLDYDSLSRYKWRSLPSRTKECYAVRTNKDKQTIRMHRQIVGAEKNSYVDHINRNTLDNRRSNLRVCSNSQNLSNAKLNKRNTTGFKGVFKNGNRWRVKIAKINIGYFSDVISDAEAYDTAAVKYFGEFALTNKMLGLYKNKT